MSAIRVSAPMRRPVRVWRSRPPTPPRIPVGSRPDGWQRACTYAPIASKFLGDGSRCLHHLRVACRPVTRCNPRRRAVAPTRPEPDRGSFLETPSAAASVGHERSVVAALVAVSSSGRALRPHATFLSASPVIGPMPNRNARRATPDEDGGAQRRCRLRGSRRTSAGGVVDGTVSAQVEKCE